MDYSEAIKFRNDKECLVGTKTDNGLKNWTVTDTSRR